MSVARRARHGRFITLEGGEGAGKSTQASRLGARLTALGLECVLTREPGGSPGAERLREALLSGAVAALGPAAEALVFSAARIDHLDITIRPALARGAWVVCDRFIDSTRAYQGSQGGLDPTLVEALERVTIGDMRPNLTIVLDLPPDVGLARAAERRGAGRADRFEQETLAFHEGLRRAFMAIVAAEPDRCVAVDALQSEADVARDVWACVTDRLHPERWRGPTAARAAERTGR